MYRKKKEYKTLFIRAGYFIIFVYKIMKQTNYVNPCLSKRSADPAVGTPRMAGLILSKRKTHLSGGIMFKQLIESIIAFLYFILLYSFIALA